MSQKINVAVLMGGRTAEHEISLETGRVIVNALNKDKYNVKPIIITKTGKWLIPTGYIDRLEFKTDILNFKDSNVVPLSTGYAIDKAFEEKIDVVFVAMHGPMGEDGTIQGLLELADIPYTGSNVLASSLAIHKMMSRKIFQSSGINVPKSISFKEWEWKKDKPGVISKTISYLGFPCVIKPMELGSSVGIAIAQSEYDFEKGFSEALKHCNEILVEEFLEGIELTCAVLGSINGDEPTPLVPTQIVPITSKFFDYKAKYTPGAAEEITPPKDISDKKIREVQEIALRAHKALGCGGMSRTDMIMKDETIYVLELNTIPGMTETSLYPQAAKAAGIQFPDLLDRIISIALETHKLKKKYSG